MSQLRRSDPAAAEEIEEAECVSFADDNGITDAFDIVAGRFTRPEMINPYLREHYAGPRQKPCEGELWRNPMSRELVRYVDLEKFKDGVENG